MKVALWTVDIGNYEPGITKLTFPLMERYAKKIGADFNIIKEKKFPEMGIYFEKMQLHELSKPYDWNIFVDADLLIHPDMYPFYSVVPKDTILINNFKEPCTIRFRDNKYYQRDKRCTNIHTYFFAFSNKCRNIMNPKLYMPKEEMIQGITDFFRVKLPDQMISEKGFYLDEYQITMNIARYGIKAENLKDFFMKKNLDFQKFIYHNSLITSRDNKAKDIYNMYNQWMIETM